MRLIFMITVIALAIQHSAGQTYKLNLKGSDWNIKPKYYYIAEVSDDRKIKGNAGQVLSDNAKAEAEFAQSLEDDLMNLINNSTMQDNSKIPLILSFEKFTLKETGTTAKHKSVFEYSAKLYRKHNNKRHLIYEVSGKPEFEVTGPYPEMNEKNISNAIKNLLSGFDEWINENNNIPQLGERIEVVFDKEVSTNTNDTIIWSPEYKLQWSDFKGSPRSAQFMAESNCIFSYKARTKMKDGTLQLIIKLNSGFDRNLSWVKKGELSDSLLAHEQLHFDICELSIRYLRNAIQNFQLDIFDFENQINKLFTIAWENYQLQQSLYDEETEHGIQMKQQARWQNDISNKLASLTYEGNLK